MRIPLGRSPSFCLCDSVHREAHVSKGKRKKPRGRMGLVSLARQPSYVELRLPDVKADIEKAILQHALATAVAQKRDIYGLAGTPRQNKENDFDFVLPTKRGEEYIDLMEAAPLEEFGGSYEKVPQEMRAGELATKIYALIERKSSKYPRSAKTPIHLLLYTTDWRLSLPPSVLTLLAYWLRTRQHVFETVAYYLPAGIVRPLWYPLLPADDPDLASLDEDLVAQTVAVRGDYNDVHRTEDGKTAFGYVRFNATNFTHARMCATGHIEFSRRPDAKKPTS
jgi:hypothetical protein